MRPLLIADVVVIIIFFTFPLPFPRPLGQYESYTNYMAWGRELNLVQMKGLFKRELIGEE